MDAVLAYPHRVERYLTSAYYDITTNGPPVKLTLPDRYVFKIPPSSFPQTLPPPSDHPTLAHPFTIPTNVYNALLSPNVPIGVALIYATIVIYLNAVNKERNHKPWAFSQTGLFKLLVITHNAFLAVYSAWTFIGMINAINSSFAGFRGNYGIAGAVDSLCKINGPRGMGDAATFNETTSSWSMTNRLMHLAADGLNPDSTDVGRIWNEGLAFYGFLFYLSKFYEVIDTFIILSKGRKATFLQAYHHFGAMLCMWAGIRYMSPPIWLFVLFNSGVHAIMYSFYLVSALGYSVPRRMKKILTTLQITQFPVGVIFAFSHLFIKYQIPTSAPYIYHLGDIASKVPSDASSVASTAIATASAAWQHWLKKAAFRAAGREGPAERVVNEHGQTFGIDAIHAVKDFTRREETRYRDEWKYVNCIDTSGQTFAILLNCVYLTPLAIMFIQFFAKAYQKRLERRTSNDLSETARQALYASRDAAKGWLHHVDRAVNELDETSHEVGEQDLLEGVDLQKLKEEAGELRGNITKAASNTKDLAKQEFNKRVDSKKIQDEVNKDLQKFKDGAQHLKEELTDADSSTRKNIRETSKNVGDSTSKVLELAKEKSSAAYAQAKKQLDKATGADTKEQLQSTADTVAQKAKETANKVEENTKPAAENAKKTAKDAGNKARETADNVEENAGPAAENAKKTAKDIGNKAKDKADEASKDIKEEAESAQSSPSKSKKKSNGKRHEQSHTGADNDKKAQENGTKKDEAKQHDSPEPGSESWVKMDESSEDIKEKKEEEKIMDDTHRLREQIVGQEGADSGGKKDKKADEKEKKKEDKIMDDTHKLRDEIVGQQGAGK